MHACNKKEQECHTPINKTCVFHGKHERVHVYSLQIPDSVLLYPRKLHGSPAIRKLSQQMLRN